MKKLNNENYSDNKKSSDIEMSKDTSVRIPSVDIIEKGDNIEVISDMPGVDKNKIDIQFEDSVLTITAWQKDYKPKDLQSVSADYVKGVFKRAFNVLTEIDVDKISAKYNDGVLTVTLPKHEKVKPKKVEVKVG